MKIVCVNSSVHGLFRLLTLFLCNAECYCALLGFILFYCTLCFDVFTNEIGSARYCCLLMSVSTFMKLFNVHYLAILLPISQY